jgi:putative membrane protein
MPHLHHAALGFTLILFFTALAYLRGWLSLRSSIVNVTSAWRALSFLVGLFLIWVAVASPVAELDHQLLTVHMVKHLLLMTLAPLLIWLGEPVLVLVHGLPRSPLRIFHRPLLRRIGDLFGRTQFCWLFAAGALVIWHVPGIFALGMKSAAWHFVEQSSFLAAGLLFWWPVVHPWPSVSKSDSSMILYLFFATLPCDILSGFLVFSDRVVYPIYFSSSHLLGFSPLVDQQCAAALMWTCITIIYFVAGAILTMRLLSPKGFSQAGLGQSELCGAGIARRVSQSLEAL